MSAAPEACACGAELVACDYCGDLRCLTCDPYSEDWADCAEQRAARAAGDPE